MENEPFVQILLATYNGEKYLTEQLDSLITQTYTNWECLISDDCSTDKTLEIIEKYCHTDSRFKLVSKGIKHSSLNENFLDLMQHSSAEYILFCDQDDYWLENKVETLVGRIITESKDNYDIPICVFSDAYIANSRLEIINDSFQSTLKNDASIVSLIDLLSSNVVQGCSSILNRKLIEDIIAEGNFSYFNYYDWLFGSIAKSQGKLIYIPDRLCLYRTHIDQMVGTKNESTIHYLLRLLHSVIFNIEEANIIIKIDASVIGRGKRILQRFPPYNQKDYADLEYLDTFSNSGFLARTRILKHFKWFNLSAKQRIALFVSCITNIDWRTHF